MKYLYPAKKIGALIIVLFFISFVSFSQNNTAKDPAVELISFSAQSNNNHSVFISIVTGREINASHFIIQRSVNGIDFNDAALLFTEEEDSREPRVYTYTDKLNETDTVAIYYRVKIIDRNRNFTYSDLVTGANGLTESGILASANPSQKKLRVTIPGSWLNKTVTYNIYNTHKGINKNKISNNATQTETLDITDLPAGVYTIEATNGDQTAVQRFAKIN